MSHTNERLTLDELRAFTDVQLAERRTEVHWRIATIDGQLIDPDFQRLDENWQGKARAALNYARREVGAINNIVTERAAQRREAGQSETTLLEVFAAFHREHVAVGQILDADPDEANDRAWEWLEQTHKTLDCIEVRQWTT